MLFDSAAVGQVLFLNHTRRWQVIFSHQPHLANEAVVGNRLTFQRKARGSWVNGKTDARAKSKLGGGLGSRVTVEVVGQSHACSNILAGKNGKCLGSLRAEVAHLGLLRPPP